MSVWNNTYNLTELANSQNTRDLIIVANNYSGHILFNMLLLAVWIILFVSLLRYETPKAFLAASFFCMVLSLVFIIAGFTNINIFIIFLLLTAFSGFVAVFSGAFSRK